MDTSCIRLLIISHNLRDCYCKNVKEKQKYLILYMKILFFLFTVLLYQALASMECLYFLCYLCTAQPPLPNRLLSCKQHLQGHIYKFFWVNHQGWVPKLIFMGYQCIGNPDSNYENENELSDKRIPKAKIINMNI